MSDKITQFAKFQKYRFDFGTDDKLYVAIFNAKIPQGELKELISSLQNCLFEKMPEIILLYLRQHHFEFSNFNSIELLLENHDVIEWAEYLLHSDTYRKVDENLENTDFYYAVMDYQNTTPKGNQEGYYFTVQRTAWGMGNLNTMLLPKLISIIRKLVMNMDIFPSGRPEGASSIPLTA